MPSLATAVAPTREQEPPITGGIGVVAIVVVRTGGGTVTGGGGTVTGGSGPLGDPAFELPVARSPAPGRDPGVVLAPPRLGIEAVVATLVGDEPTSLGVDGTVTTDGAVCRVVPPPHPPMTATATTTAPMHRTPDTPR